MTVDHDRDDELLDALSQGLPVPPDDALAGLFTAWHSEIEDSLPPLRLPTPSEVAIPAQHKSIANNRWRRLIGSVGGAPDSGLSDPAGSRPGDAGAQPGDAGGAGSRAGDAEGAGSSAADAGGGTRKPGARHGRAGGAGSRPGDTGTRRKWRVPRPAVIGAVAAAMVFGGLTAATASAEPGSPFWPITQMVFSDKASSKLAEQDAVNLLNQARQALTADQRAELVGAARAKIALITDPAVRERLLAEADAILAKTSATAPTPLPSNAELPSGAPAVTPANPTPSPEKSGLLPPILPSILPTLPLPSLPLPSLPLPELPLLG